MASSADPSVEVMLDSGAYSAWYHGKPLDLIAYIDYCKSHARLFNSVVALDQIPGTNKRAAKTAGDVENAARQSFDNYHLMRKAGLKVIPVFHQGEDFEWLERMVKDGCDYIGISPYPRAGQETILRWLDECFTRISDHDGNPIVKTHGFGATSWGMITRYPWFSIDSTTWALAAGYATIIMPPFVTASSGQRLIPDYASAPLRFSISDRDQAGSRALLRQPPIVQQVVLEYLRKAGLTLSLVRSSDRFRAQANAHYYVQLEASLGINPFAHRRVSHRQRLKKLVGFNYRPRVIFAEQMGKHEYGRALEKVGANKRLISYYECRKYPDAELAVYCQHGILAKLDRKPKGRDTQSWDVNRRLGLLKRLAEPDPDE